MTYSMYCNESKMIPWCTDSQFLNYSIHNHFAPEPVICAGSKWCAEDWYATAKTSLDICYFWLIEIMLEK